MKKQTLNMYSVLALALAAPRGRRAEIYSVIVAQLWSSETRPLRTATAVDRTAGTVSLSLSAKASGVPADGSGSAVGAPPILQSLRPWHSRYSASLLHSGVGTLAPQL